MRWNKPGSYDYRTQQYYGIVKPRTPVVYMVDYPTGAFVTATGVRNVALEFNTCIYKARNVPAATRRDDIHFAKPINCFQWRNVYVYDFDRGKFQTRLTDVPHWREPSTRINVSLLVISLTLLIAVTLATLALSGKFASKKDPC